MPSAELTRKPSRQPQLKLDRTWPATMLTIATPLPITTQMHQLLAIQLNNSEEQRKAALNMRAYKKLTQLS